MRKALAGLALLCTGLVGCTVGGEVPTPKQTTPHYAEDMDVTTAESRELTQQLFQITWNAAPEDQKDAMCEGIQMFGTGFAARQMQRGGDTTYGDDIDWDYTAELMGEECAKR